MGLHEWCPVIKLHALILAFKEGNSREIHLGRPCSCFLEVLRLVSRYIVTWPRKLCIPKLFIPNEETIFQYRFQKISHSFSKTYSPDVTTHDSIVFTGFYVLTSAPLARPGVNRKIVQARESHVCFAVGTIKSCLRVFACVIGKWMMPHGLRVLFTSFLGTPGVPCDAKR